MSAGVASRTEHRGRGRDSALRGRRAGGRRPVRGPHTLGRATGPHSRPSLAGGGGTALGGGKDHCGVCKSD
eukprot:576334-Prymnesium_polylepis.1